MPALLRWGNAAEEGDQLKKTGNREYDDVATSIFGPAGAAWAAIEVSGGRAGQLMGL
jgi:hypothetical protein